MKHKIKVLLTKKQIESRVRFLAKKISEDFSGKEISFLFISNGAIIFTADIIRRITGKVRLDSIRASSYIGTNSSGKVKITSPPQISLEGANVIIVDDIIDTGRTISRVITYVRKKKPATIRTCALLDKPSRRVVPFIADYVGFTIDDVFVVGYGLDYNELYRNLPYVGYIEQ